jgi:hypothetical protein
MIVPQVRGITAMATGKWRWQPATNSSARSAKHRSRKEVLSLAIQNCL